MDYKVWCERQGIVSWENVSDHYEKIVKKKGLKGCKVYQCVQFYPSITRVWGQFLEKHPIPVTLDTSYRQMEDAFWWYNMYSIDWGCGLTGTIYYRCPKELETNGWASYDPVHEGVVSHHVQHYNTFQCKECKTEYGYGGSVRALWQFELDKLGIPKPNPSFL